MKKRTPFIKYGLIVYLTGQLIVGPNSSSYGCVRLVRLVVVNSLPIPRQADNTYNPVGQLKSPSEIWRAIKALAKSSAYLNSTLIVRPQFIVKSPGPSAQLELVKGSVGDLGFGSDPYRVPFEKQILIEVIRRALAETSWLKLSVNKRSKSSTKNKKQTNLSKISQSDKFGETYLEKAEALIKKSVIDIAEISDATVLKVKLDKAEHEIDSLLYNDLYEAIEQRAKELGYNIIYGRGGSRGFGQASSEQGLQKKNP